MARRTARLGKTGVYFRKTPSNDDMASACSSALAAVSAPLAQRSEAESLPTAAVRDAQVFGVPREGRAEARKRWYPDWSQTWELAVVPDAG